MAYTIPETIVGIPLFVPSTHDTISLEADGMPNGNPCLRVRGDSDPDFLAFHRGKQTPTKLQQWTDTIVSDTTGISMTFWIKVADPGTPSGVFMSCKSFETAYVTGSTGGGGSSWARWWIEISEASGKCKLTMRMRGTANAILDRATSPFTYDEWHLITFTVARISGTSLSMGAFVDDDLTAMGTVGSGASPAPLNSALVTMICLGSYHSAYAGANCDFRIAKWAFHDHPLTQAERNTLYLAMRTGQLDFTDDFSASAADYRWTTIPTLSAWTIASGQANGVSTFDRNMMYDQSLGTLNQYTEIDVVNHSGGVVGLLTRVLQLTTPQFYSGRYNQASGGTWEIQRRIGGTVTGLVSNATPDPTPPYRMRFTAETVGTDVVLNLYEIVAGSPVLRATYTDNSGSKITTGTWCGVRLTGTATTQLADNFACGPL